MSYAVDARNLKKSFNGTEVVSGIHLRVKKGELFALLGPNGAGKTTTIEMLSTLLKPDSGTAVVVELNPISIASAAVRGIMNGTAVTGTIIAGIGICLLLFSYLPHSLFILSKKSLNFWQSLA